MNIFRKLRWWKDRRLQKVWGEALNIPKAERASLWKEYLSWCAEHERPGELVSIGYYVKVLDRGKSEWARNWGKKL